MCDPFLTGGNHPTVFVLFSGCKNPRDVRGPLPQQTFTLRFTRRERPGDHSLAG